MFPPLIQNLIEEFNKLPGVGPKTSQRFVFYLLSRPPETLRNLAQILIAIKEKIILCNQCQNFAETDPCHICNDARRDQTLICVVSKPQDLVALEQIGEFKGVYHILGGVIDSAQGINPENLKINELLKKVKQNKAKEIILALNPDLEGETTILYLTKLLKHLGIKISRLARGLPRGADLEYADEVTLNDALHNRKTI